MRPVEFSSGLSPCVNRALEISVSGGLTCGSEEHGEMNALIQALSGWVRGVMILKQSTIGGFTEHKTLERTVQRFKRTDANTAATSSDPYSSAQVDQLYVHIKLTQSSIETERKFTEGELFNFCTTSSNQWSFSITFSKHVANLTLVRTTASPTSNSEIGCYFESLKEI